MKNFSVNSFIERVLKKNTMKYFSLLLLIGLFITSCEKDNMIDNIGIESSGEIENRSYNQEDCGFAQNFCESEPRYPVAVARVAGGNGGGVEVKVRDESFSLLPFEIYDGSIGMVVNTGREVYIGHRSDDDYLLSKSDDVEMSGALNEILDIDYDDDYSRDNVVKLMEVELGTSNVGSSTEPVFTLPERGDKTDITWIKECEYILVSKVDNFIDVFFEQGEASQIVGIIEDGFNACPPAYPNYGGNIPNRCLNYCIDPRCVVDFIIDYNSNALSDYQKRVMVSRYLQETIGLTDEQQNWLTFNDQSDLIFEIYDGLLTNQNLSRCNREDCGLAGGYHELIVQNMANETLTADETSDLLEFFSVMQCDDPTIFACFREAQQNPDGDIAAMLNEIKLAITTEANTLLDNCDDLVNYSDGWFELASLDAAQIPVIKDKLESLGDDYWIQTLENAQPNDIGTSFGMAPYFKWWLYAPPVNMDFFGVTIETLPINPHTGVQFTAAEFIDYIQLNFASEEFMGADNECGPSFDFINSNEADNWADGDPITTVITIEMPDDGNVIAVEHVPGEYWTFATLNAPGWLEGDSWDGYHPVSGNRRFGLIENPDGSFTFYTTGVDRLTGWWHALANPLVGAFGEADELWACVMGLVGDFVNENGGVASSDLDCVTVRPEWTQLKNALRQGCDGFAVTIEDFPCEEAEPCE